MKETRAILDARTELEEALRLMDEADTKIQSLPADVSEEERDFHKNTFARSEKAVAEARERLERAIAIQKAREAVPPVSDEEPTEAEKRAGYQRVKIAVGDEEPTYRKDKDGATTFVKDLFFSVQGDATAAERLGRHKMETRDVDTADPGAGVFVPPQYLANEWAELPRESRPFANALPNRPLMATGMSFTIPRLTTGATVAVQQTEADAPSETDGDGTLLTVNVRTIAGQQDMSIQAFERTDPGFGEVILSDLRAAYDSYLDTQLLSGTGSNGQLPGIRGVTGRNTVTYTDATPTSAELLPKVYDAIQQIADGRKANPDLVVMHPRRAAWLASNLSSSFPLFQQGQLMQAAGTQDGGFLQSFAGLRVIIDSNVGVLYGSGTNEDEVYVVRSADLAVYESPLRVRVLPEVLSGTLQVKVQVFAYAAFASGKQPEAIGHISGTGLAAPSF